LRTRQGVELALNQAEDGLRKGRLPAVEAALTQAAQRLGNGPADLSERLKSLRKDLAMVRTLDEIRDLHRTLVDGKQDRFTANRQYPTAFLSFNIRLDYRPEDTVRSVRSSPIGWRLIRGLDEWLFVAEELPM